MLDPHVRDNVRHNVHHSADIALDRGTNRYVGRVDAELRLEQPTTRIALSVPAGEVGRAEARFGDQSWAAAHFWQDRSGSPDVATFEFSEAIPAGAVHISIPFSGTLTPELERVALALASGDEEARARSIIEQIVPHPPAQPEVTWSVAVRHEGIVTGAAR